MYMYGDRTEKYMQSCRYMYVIHSGGSKGGGGGGGGATGARPPKIGSTMFCFFQICLL